MKKINLRSNSNGLPSSKNPFTEEKVSSVEPEETRIKLKLVLNKSNNTNLKCKIL